MDKKYCKIVFKSTEWKITDDIDRLLTALYWWLNEGVTGFTVHIITEEEEYQRLLKECNK